MQLYRVNCYDQMEEVKFICETEVCGDCITEIQVEDRNGRVSRVLRGFYHKTKSEAWQKYRKRE